MAFERAPPEVLGLCLRQASSPEDVGAAIRASPNFLRAFLCQERAILTSVLQRCMGVDALKQALSITRCPVWAEGDNRSYYDRWNDTTESGSDVDFESSTWGQKMNGFLMGYHWGSFRFPRGDYLSTHTLKAICRLRAKVNCIIADYITFTEIVSDVHGPEPALYAPDKRGLGDLSQEELGRLQGAFFRYELLCRSWGWPYFHFWLETHKHIFMDDFDFYGSRLDPWDREGIVVVHRYVLAKYTAVVQEIVEDFTATVDAISERDHASLASSSQPSVRELLGEDGPSFLLEVGWRSNRGYVTICADNLARLGLGFLLKVLKSSRQYRRDLMRDVFDIFCPRNGSWFPQDDYNFVWAAEEVIRDLDDDRAQKKMKTGGNSAWKALMSRFDDNGDFDYSSYRDLEQLRKLGWVFWDDARLLDLEIVRERSAVPNGLALGLEPYISAQPLYGELRRRAPILPVLRQRISRDIWAKQIVPHFYTKPHPGFEARQWPCESNERLMEVVDLAYRNALDRSQ